MLKLNPLAKATILVVDDTPDNLALISNLLKDDYRVKIATGGEKALDIAASDTPPDLILLDIMMSGMDGYEVCRRLKRNPKTMNIPVIFLTAKTEVEDEQKGLELGAVDYLTKPVSPPIVMARVKNHLALKAMADFLNEKNLELESAKSLAEKANLAKSSFLSSMSHELRSPLNAILGFAQLMESETPPPTPSQMESIEQILQAGWHLLALINDILDLAKVESGQIPMLRESVSLPEVMLECQNMTEPQAQQRGIRMYFPQVALTCFVMADRTRVKQVLINLLSNAIKYNTKEGTVAVTCTESGPECIRVSVRDTGAGLPPEQLAQLFQPFNRLGQEAGNEEGTGIGLMVAKRLVELMGGTIGVESTVGVGSVFWFELLSAAKPPVAAAGDDAAQLPRPQVPREARQHTLLAVEDNPANLKLVEQIIARHPDIHLLSAVNGKSGIETARLALPDVILMDINLPDVSGYEALKVLRSDPATAQIPVIAISASAMALDIKKGREAGFFRYITKPLKINEFLEALDLALEYAEQQRGPR
ncbi:MAG: response regulator [Desulfobulbaceae bacterium]|nr:response regulator [Desulfobulbaceae bacterium]